VSRAHVWRRNPLCARRCNKESLLSSIRCTVRFSCRIFESQGMASAVPMMKAAPWGCWGSPGPTRDASVRAPVAGTPTSALQAGMGQFESELSDQGGPHFRHPSDACSAAHCCIVHATGLWASPQGCWALAPAAGGKGGHGVAQSALCVLAQQLLSSPGTGMGGCRGAGHASSGCWRWPGCAAEVALQLWGDSRRCLTCHEGG